MQKLGIKKGRWEEAPKGNKMGILKPAGASPRPTVISSKGSKKPPVLSPKNNKQTVILQDRAQTPKEQSSKMTSYLTQFDGFGQPITMTYKGNDRYYTCCGAFLTIFGKSIMLGVLVWGILNLVNQTPRIQFYQA